MTQEPEYSGPGAARAAFTHRDTHPLILDLLLVKEFGPEYVGWEPVTVWTGVQRKWSTPVSDANKNKIQAVRVCRSTDTPYEEWPVFEDVAGGLFGITPDIEVLQRQTPHRCAAAMDIMTQVRDVKFSTEVLRYIGACMLDQGVIYGPGTLIACNEFIAPIVGSSAQNRVAAAVARGVAPTFDGTNDDDVQVMKSLSVVDYQRYMNELLLKQLNRLFEGTKGGANV